MKHSLCSSLSILTAISGLVLPATNPVQAQLAIYLPENATYHYVNATAETIIGSVPSNWFTPSFDDANWFNGIGPFGNSFAGNLSNASGPQTPDSPDFPQGTDWSVNYDPYLRTAFNLPQPMDLTLWLAVDNGVNGIYLNGVQATAAVNAEGPAFRWEHVFDIPKAYTFAGINTLALQLEDHGVATGYALVITTNDLTSNPVFTTNPPPIQAPEPGSMALLAGTLAGIIFSRCNKQVWRKIPAK